MILLLSLLSASVHVAGIFPSATVLPANLLRIYVHFSAPMTRNGIGRHVHLLEEGRPVERAFLEVEDGLWDPEGRRLTLFFHPGRLKRGLAIRESMGPPLRPGLHYRLVVTTDAMDENHQPLAEEFVKEFTAGPEDRTSPVVKKWVIQAPAAGSRDSLVVTADKPLDRALFARLLSAEDSRGHRVPGEASIEADETRWRFIPREAWRRGRYSVRVAAELEDVAGNRPTRLFDEPANGSGRRAEAHDVTIAFKVISRSQQGAASPRVSSVDWSSCPPG
jgi:hypothetical protein